MEKVQEPEEFCVAVSSKLTYSLLERKEYHKAWEGNLYKANKIWRLRGFEKLRKIQDSQALLTIAGRRGGSHAERPHVEQGSSRDAASLSHCLHWHGLLDAAAFELPMHP